MKITSTFTLASLSVLTLFSCGGGGVSEDFTRQINEVETAWKNTTGAFEASLDSVEQAQKGWATMMQGMTVPDSLQSRLTPEYKNRLDSVMQICQKEGVSYENLKVELEKSRLDWENDTKVFATWKDKVLKSEIDIETARKDLKDYQDKIKSTTAVSNDVASKLSGIRQHCAANCQVYDSLKANIPKEEPVQPRRRRGR